MKKTVTIISVAALLACLLGSLWWLTRRRPGAVPPVDTPEMAFTTAPDSGGVRIQHQDPQTPLRALRWLPPLQGGFSLVQVVTQTDRQQLTVFKDGAYRETYLVPKPAGVRDGFFRLAELRSARLLEGDVAVLLYALPPGSSTEPSLVLALDLGTRDVRWTHRTAGEQLVLSEIKDGVVYLFGPQSTPVRLPIATASGEKVNASGERSSARSIELTPEILRISDLEPTGAWTFLLAHDGGLSVYLGAKGWKHQTVPEGNPGLFPGATGILCAANKKYWWQPYPGTVLQILADGTPKALWSSRSLATAPPHEKDASLLRLLGADATGRLWFDLLPPSQPVPVAAEPPASTEATEGAETRPEPPAVQLEDWPGYVAQGLERIYAWDVEKRSLQRMRWADLATPTGFPRPAQGFRFEPSSGALFLENGDAAWTTPLVGFPFKDPSPVGKPDQPR